MDDSAEVERIQHIQADLMKQRDLYQLRLERMDPNSRGIVRSTAQRFSREVRRLDRLISANNRHIERLRHDPGLIL